MLVSEVIDRTLNNWLYPAGVNRPSFDILASTVDADTLTLTVEQRVTIPRDSILEIGSELVLTEESLAGTITAAERGYLDTVPAAHSAGARVYLDPMFSRKTIFDTLCTVVGELYPAGVYRRTIDDSTVTWTTGAAVALPSGTGQVLKATVVRAYTSPADYVRLRPERGEYEVLYEFDPPKIKLVSGGYSGAQVIVVVAKDFTLPTDETKDLTTVCGIPASLVPHLPLAIAGNILQSRELPRIMVEEVRRLLASQGVEVGAAVNVGQVLLNLFTRKVDAERRRLAQLDPLVFEMSE